MPAHTMDELVACVFHRGLGYGKPDGQQARPFQSCRDQLRARGIIISLCRAESDRDRHEAIDQCAPDVVVDLRHWSQPAEDILQFIRGIREHAAEPRYILMDYYAPSSSPHLPLAGEADLYAKRQTLADCRQYDRVYEGGYIFTDFLVREMGFDIGHWHFGERIPVDVARRIMPIWNLGAVERYDRIARWDAAQPPWSCRPIDLNTRIGLTRKTSREEWYQTYRRMCIEAARSFPARMRHTGTERVSRKLYYAELLMSRIVFSPFGWGEVCFRDYEAAACGCLLLKQDMSHLTTEPDIYVPMESYVPVRWDLKDLHEKIAWARSNRREAAAIAAEGRRRLRAYFAAGGPVPTITRMLRHAATARTDPLGASQPG